jgi:hypothetical protein
VWERSVERDYREDDMSQRRMTSAAVGTPDSASPRVKHPASKRRGGVQQPPRPPGGGTPHRWTSGPGRDSDGREGYCLGGRTGSQP